MKRLFCIILITIVFVLCSCNSTTEKTNDSESVSNNSSFSAIEKELLGTWETSFNGNKLICIFEEDGNGRFIGNDNEPMPFTYKIISDNQIEQTMVTIEGKEDTSIYNFEFKGDKLVFDGFEYTRE